jgi:hypothetical protein
MTEFHNAAATPKPAEETTETTSATTKQTGVGPSKPVKLLTREDILRAVDSAPEDDAVDRLTDTAAIVGNSQAVQTAAKLRTTIVPDSTMRLLKMMDDMERRSQELERMVQLPKLLEQLPTARILDDYNRTQAAIDRLGLDSIDRIVSPLLPLQVNASAWRFESVQRNLLRDIEAMNSTWHRGLFTAPTLPTITIPTVDLSAFETAARLTSELHRLISYWRHISSTATWLGRRARSGYLSAMAARSAAVRGEMEPVAEFIAVWLGLKPTKELVEAVAAALLEAGWDAQPDDVLQVIGTRAFYHRRAQRPVFETQLNGRRLALLSEPVAGFDGGSELTVADVITDHSTPEQLYLHGEFCWPVEAVLNGLKDPERAVALAYAYGGKQVSWTEAAAQTGAEDPEKTGDSVRRKLKRLGNERKRRGGEF